MTSDLPSRIRTVVAVEVGCKRVASQKLPFRVELVRELRRLGVTMLALGFVDGTVLVEVDEQHVFHDH